MTQQVYETRREAQRAIRSMLDELDVFATYVVYTGNPAFTAEAQGFRFLNGRSEPIPGLPADADPEDRDEREERLKWFLNCEPKEVMMRNVEDPNTGRRVTEYGWRLAYRLEKQGSETPPAKTKEKVAA